MKRSLVRTLALGAVALVGLAMSTSSAVAAFGTINNDAWLRSTDGQPIFAHSHYVAKFGNTYYLYGQQYVGSQAYYNNGSHPSDGSEHVSTNVYTSTDLINWTPKVVAWDGGTYMEPGDWAGRCWGVLFNATSNKYVMWMKYQGAKGGGGLCLTSNSPLGPFTVDHLQTSVDNIFSTPARPGDSKFFYAANGTPYLACSDSHGRQRAYVAPLSSDYKTVNAVIQIALWPEGQEGNTALYAPTTNRYYYFTSETNGWSYSHAFVVNSTSLSSGYGGRVILPGTDATNTYWSQTVQAIKVEGTSDTAYMLLCDRWGVFSSNYANAGHGTGYHVWEPLTISGSNVTFHPLGIWYLDAAAGVWQTTPPVSGGSAPSYLGSSLAVSGTGTITPLLPANLQTNDILLCFVETANQAVTISNPNGGTWGTVATQSTGTAGGTDGARLTVFWSRYNGTQLSPTVSDSGDHQIAKMIAIRGATTSGNPWDVTAGDVDTFTDNGAAIPGATTTVADTLVVLATAGATPDAIGTSNFTGWTNSNLSSLTERGDNTKDDGNGGSLGIATGVKATAGSYGTTTVTHASASKKGMISIAIKN